MAPSLTRSSFVSAPEVRSPKIQLELRNGVCRRTRRQTCAAQYDAYVYCDGSSRERQNVCGLGVIVRFPNSDQYRFASRRLEDTHLTSMEVEYWAIDFALSYVDSIFDYDPRVLVLSDQLSVVKQIIGEQKVRDQYLLDLRQEVYDWGEYFNGIYYKWIPRKKNKLANGYARKASRDNWTTWDHVKN